METPGLQNCMFEKEEQILFFICMSNNAELNDNSLLFFTAYFRFITTNLSSFTYTDWGSETGDVIVNFKYC